MDGWTGVATTCQIASVVASPSASGTLGEKPLAHLLSYLFDKQLTGSLEVWDGARDERAIVSTVRGGVRTVKTSAPVCYLGSLVYEMGLIDAGELDASLMELSRRRGALHGAVLVARGALRPPQLAAVLTEQTLRKLSYIFTFGDASAFAFYVDDDRLVGYGGTDAPLVDPRPAIWRGLRDAVDGTRFDAFVARVGGARFKLVPGATIDRFGLSADEYAVAECLGIRPMTLLELRTLGVVPAAVVDRILYCMVMSRQLEVAADAAVPSMSRAETRAYPSASVSSDAFRAVSPNEAVTAYRPPTAAALRSASSDGHAVTGTRPVTMSVTRTVEAADPEAWLSDGAASSGRVARAATARGLGAEGDPRSRPTSSSSAAIGAAFAERARFIRERAVSIAREDHFSRLSVAKDAPPAQVDKEYFSLASYWDPGSLPPELESVRSECTAVFIALSESYEVLSNPRKRQAYLQELAVGRAGAYDPAPDLAASGGRHPLEGAKMCLHRNDLERAERLARHASQSDPRDASALALLAWLEALRPENQTVDATLTRVMMLDRAVEIDRRCEDALFYRAQLHGRLENHRSAMRDLMRVVELDPGHMPAVRALRVYHMRVKKGSIQMQAPDRYVPRSASSSGVMARSAPPPSEIAKPPLDGKSDVSLKATGSSPPPPLHGLRRGPSMKR